MNETLITELKKFFSLDENDSLNKLQSDKKVNSIEGLSVLVQYLNQPETPPKIILKQLEDVIVCLALKQNKATHLEKELLLLLREIQANPELDRGNDLNFMKQ